MGPFFGASRSNNSNATASNTSDGKEVFIDDLVLHPKRIDAKLESKIAEWEAALNDYQAFEDICREEIEAELLPILEDLRERPKCFKDKKYSVNVQTLANKLIKVKELQAQLETTSRDDDSSSLGTRLKYYFCCACLNSLSRRSDQETDNLRDSVQISNNMSMSDKLSARWALRLNEIDPTQGTLQRGASLKLSMSAPTSQPVPIKIKPKWPDFLIDTYFDVIKVNMYGRKMRRIIKLTQHYVVNITNGEEISKFYAYRDIRRVWLENNNMIVVVLKSGKQTVYMSHIAPHVLQQITTRVQVRRSLDNAEYHGPAFNLGYSAAVTAGIIKNISEENTLDSEAVVALFANELKERTVRSIAGTAGAANTAGAAGTANSDINNNNPSGNNEFRSNRSSINTLPSLMEHAEYDAEGNKTTSQDEGDEINPLHLSAKSNAANKTTNNSSETDATTDPINSNNTKLEIVPPMPNFSSPFTNAIQNATGEVPLDRKTSHNSATSEASETSFHTADSYINPLTYDPEGTKHLTSNSSNSTTPTAETATTPPPAPVVREAPRFLSFKEGMPEFYVQSALQTLIFDTTTSEGNTRKLFIDRFKSACIATIVNGNAGTGARGSLPQGTLMSKTKSIKGATLVEVRHFIDGMHEYILGNRGVSLSLLYEREKQRSIILQATSSSSSISVSPTNEAFSPNSGNSDGAERVVPSAAPMASPGGRGMSRGNSKRGLLTRGKSTDKAGLDLKTFQSPHTTAVSDNDLTSRASLQFLKDNNLDLSMIDERVVVFISFIIFMVVEESIFLPLKADLINLLPSSNKQEEEQQLLEKMKALSTRTQQQWGIPDELISPLGWQTAIFELQGLEHNLTPSSQLHVLTRTVKAVYNEFKHVILPIQQQRGGGSVSCIAADDLVPIFIYIFCRSGLKHPMRSRDLMWSLCHPDQLQGEGGYYLTVFESSIEFVLHEALDRESFAVSSAYATPTTSAADDASALYIHGLRHSINANHNTTNRASNGHLGRSSAGRGSALETESFAGTPFDISSDFHDAGLARLSLGGSGALSGQSAGGLTSGRSSGSGGYNSGSQGYHSPSKNSSRVNSSNSTSAASDALRSSGTLTGPQRDSIIGTLAHRLTLSNLLTRKPAPDNTTRESFG